MTGDVIDTLELWGGDLTAELRFVDWDQPDHRDTDGYAIPRYSLKVDHGGESASFTAWGSIHEAEQQEPTGTAARYLSTVAGEAMYYYDHGGRRGWLDRSVTLDSLTGGDFAPIIDDLAEEWGGAPPSDAIRSFRAIVDMARKFDRLGLDRDDLGALHQDADAAEAAA